jgi:hypothetical protein
LRRYLETDQSVAIFRGGTFTNNHEVGFLARFSKFDGQLAVARKTRDHYCGDIVLDVHLHILRLADILRGIGWGEIGATRGFLQGQVGDNGLRAFIELTSYPPAN